MLYPGLERLKKYFGKKTIGKNLSRTLKMPRHRVLINGLGQAAATLCAQAKGDPNDPHMAVYEALQNWLCGSDEAAPYKSYQENKGLLIAITKEDRNSYLHAQAEALAYLEWYKKLAIAFLKEDSKKKASD